MPTAQRCSGGGGGGGGGGAAGSSPWWLSALAWICVLWTVLVAGLRYGPFPSSTPAATGPATTAGAAAPPAESRRARSVAERHACLDLVVREMLPIDANPNPNPNQPAGGRVKTSGPFPAFSVCHFVGSLLFWPLGVRARSVGRREQVSGDDTVSACAVYSYTL